MLSCCLFDLNCCSRFFMMKDGFYPNLLLFSLTCDGSKAAIALLKVVLNWNDRLKSFVLCIFEHCIVSHDFGHHFIIDDHHGAGEKEASITGWMMFNFPTFTQILQIKMFKNETIFASNNLEQNKFVRT